MKIETIYFLNIRKEFTYYIGQNEVDNFKIIDMSNPDDIWFHSSDNSSCHVILRITEPINKKELQTVCKKGALLCKENTNKLKKLSNVEFIYTYIKNIVKTEKNGCVITQNTKKIVC